ncbi:MAG: hypothetical protein H0U74_23710 [Bradymonadaceae bacterium]|nr:hypothetical protein [Lujinxingiaceae bacterium]
MAKHFDDDDDFCARAAGAPGMAPDVVSLCEIRARARLDASSERLIVLLTSLHELSIGAHNQLITKSRVSVLSELTQSLNVYFDLVPAELRACVLTPFALYGLSLSRIYGKEPLQKRVQAAVRDRESRELLESLQATPYQVWCYHHRDGGRLDAAHPFAGPAVAACEPFAGVITRAGELTRNSGLYSGWPIRFEGFCFLAFGHPVDKQTAHVVGRLAQEVAAASAEDFAKAFEFALARKIVDPLSRRSRAKQPLQSPSLSNAYKPHRWQIINRVRQVLEDEFSHPKSFVTLRVHIAELAGDAQGVSDFLCAVALILEEVLLSSRGLREGEAAISVAEILEPYHVLATGIDGAENLQQHPLAVLLLDFEDDQDLPFDRLSSISDALYWARRHVEHPCAIALQRAWESYQMEQLWLATHGIVAGRDDVLTDPRTASGHERLLLLPDLRAVFAPGYFELAIDTLPIATRDKGRFLKAFARSRWYSSGATLASLPEQEEMLTHIEGLGDKTIGSLRSALLIHARDWRWQRAGLDPRQCRSASANKVSEDGDDALRSGLDELASLFD